MSRDIYDIFGNETRVKLIRCLSERPKNVGELILVCGMSQSAVSQHLAKLKEAKLVSTEKHGQEVWYTLTYKKAARISELLNELQKEI